MLIIDKVNCKIKQHPVYLHIYYLLKHNLICNEFYTCLCYIHYAEDVHKQLLSDETLPTTVWHKIRYM